MQPEELARVDAWIDAQFTNYTRPEAIRTLVDLGLAYRERAAARRKSRR